VFVGGFSGIIESMANALIADLNPLKTDFYINFAQVFMGIGALSGPIIAGILLASGISWRMCYYIIGGLLSLVTIMFLVNKLPEHLPKPDRVTWVGFKNLVTDWKFILICICMAFYTGSEVGGWGWISTFLKNNMNFSIQKSSLAVSVFWIAITAGRLLFSSLTLKFGVRILTIILAFASAAVTALSGVVQGEFAVWVVVAAMGFMYSAQWSLILAYGSSRYKVHTGTVFSLLVGSGGIGMALIPLLMGIIGQFASIRAAMISPAILFMFIAVAFTSFSKKPHSI